MPVPFRLGGGSGFYNGIPIQTSGLSDAFENLLNEGRLKNTSFNYNSLQPVNQQGVGTVFQNLLNDVTSNPARLTPGYNPSFGQTGYTPETQQLINAFRGQGLNFSDDTGSVSLTRGGIGLRSKNGWNASVNPQGGELNVGPLGIQGTWAGDKSIQATFALGQHNAQIPGMYPPMMSQFVSPEFNKPDVYPMSDTDKQTVEKYGNLNTEYIPIQYQGFGLARKVPLKLSGPTVDVPLSAGRKLMEEQTDEYIRNNPDYQYRPGYLP